MSTPSENFAEQLKTLESIVERMEQQTLPLEESLALYARGVELTRKCHTMLQDAEKKIQDLNDETMD